MIFTAKKFKWKYLVISLVLIAIITATTAFSVSYAKWVGGSESLTAKSGTGTTDGTWGKPINSLGWDNVSEGIDLGDNFIIIMPGAPWENGWFSGSSYVTDAQANIGIYFLVSAGSQLSFRFQGYLIKGDEAAENKDGDIFNFSQHFTCEDAVYDPDTGRFTFAETGLYYIEVQLELKNLKGEFRLSMVDSTYGNGYIDLDNLTYIYNGTSTKIDVISKNS